MDDDPDHENNSNPSDEAVSRTSGARPKRTTSKPKKYDDMHLYNIFD